MDLELNNYLYQNRAWYIQCFREASKDIAKRISDQLNLENEKIKDLEKALLARFGSNSELEQCVLIIRNTDVRPHYLALVEHFAQRVGYEEYIKDNAQEIYDRIVEEFGDKDLPPLFSPYLRGKKEYSPLEMQIAMHQASQNLPELEIDRQKIEGRQLAQDEQSNQQFIPLNLDRIPDGPFRASYCEQWRDFHRNIAMGIAFRLEHMPPSSDDVIEQLKQIYSDQYLRWQEIDPLSAIDFHDELGHKFLISDRPLNELSEGKAVDEYLKYYVFTDDFDPQKYFKHAVTSKGFSHGDTTDNGLIIARNFFSGRG
ncbi:MAG: hypothetical protein U0R17_04205 [Acidimicrobiia bacterium]